MHIREPNHGKGIGTGGGVTTFKSFSVIIGSVF